jgi:tape measure domain-containing protein
MANSNFIETKKAINDITTAVDAQINSVTKLNTEVIQLNTSYAKLPSDYLKTQQKLAETNKQLTQTEVALTNAVKKKQALTSEEIVNQQVLRTNADRHARANSQLAGAYRNLSAQVAIASERYQNIIVRGRTAEQTQKQYNRELRQAQNEFRTLQNRILQADKAVDKWNRTNERSIGLGRDLLGAFGIVGGVTAFALIARDVFEQTKEIQSLNKALELVTGTQENFYNQQVFLQRISEAYGVELNGLTKQFTQFYVSAKDKLAGTEIQGIFESITKAGASMGLSVESQQRAFLALNQMMSKGTIQAEELRGQLGEALPGAFGIMAKAVGVTEKELAKMMKAGELIASEVLPKFAKELEKVYSIDTVNRIETLTASQNRLSNAWRNFVAELDKGNSGISIFFKNAIDLATNFIKLISPDKTAFQIQSDNIARGELEIIEELNAIKKDGIQTDKELIETAKLKRNYAFKIVEGLDWELSALRDYGIEQAKIMEKARKENPYFYANTKQYVNAQKELEETNKKIKELAVTNGYYRGVVKGTLVFEKDLTEVRKKGNEAITKTKAQLQEEERLRNELIKKLREEYLERTKIDDLKSVELEEGFLARLKQQKKAFEELQSTLSSSNKEYAEYQKLIDGIQQSIDLIEDPSKVITSTGPAEFMKKYKKETKEDLDETKSYWEKHGEEVVDLSQELINTLAEISNQRFENQLNNLEKEKNTALLFAGDSVAAREEIERQAEVRRRAILARQAKAQKEMAIFNIITDTAQAVVASLIRDPSGTLAILIGAIGAANLALVASQQVPAFKDGGIHDGGLMMVNDQKGSKYKEIIETPDGKKRIFNERNKILNAPKGTKIYNATETESILFNNELNGILTNNGISNAPTVIVDGGLSKEDFNNGISKLAKTIIEKESFSISRDKRGERVFREKQNKRTELLNVRLKMGKYDV